MIEDKTLTHFLFYVVKDTTHLDQNGNGYICSENL